MSDEIFKKGTVLDQFAGGMFEIELDSGGTVRAKLSGKMDHHDIELTVHDRVRVKFHSSDPSMGMIIERLSES